MARILLVNPHGYKFVGDQSMPLALIYAMVHLHKDHEVVILDIRMEKDWRRRLRHELKKDLLCVGVTSMTGKQIASALEVSSIVKSESKVPVVWGGIHASLLPGQTLENPNTDLLVCGEGEETFRDLVRALDRGDPYNNGNSSRRWRDFRSERVLQEVERFASGYGVRRFMFHDDNFFVDLRRVQAVAEGIIAKNMGITWEVIGVHPRILARVTPELYAILEKSGLTGIAVGVESARRAGSTS